MKVVLFGYGKMGKAIEQVILEKNNSHAYPVHEVVLKVDADNMDTISTEALQQADVAIEFTAPQSAYRNILKCFDANIPVVCGTTGWTDKLDELRSTCESNGQTFFYASNFSIGVNIFFEINRTLAKIMDKQPQYDINVHEVHHTEKLDAPSGTAITIAQDIINSVERKQEWVNRKQEKSDELGIRSYREKDVPGIHIINYESEVDSIELKHTAHSRKGFALGAVTAAEWVHDKKGFFGMKDMLRF